MTLVWRAMEEKKISTRLIGQFNILHNYEFLNPLRDVSMCATARNHQKMIVPMKDDDRIDEPPFFTQQNCLHSTANSEAAEITRRDSMKQVDCLVSLHSKYTMVRKIYAPSSIFEQRHFATDVLEFARQKPSIVFHERDAQLVILKMEG
jgi:hypothetical protein